jgi:hypothetical protein
MRVAHVEFQKNSVFAWIAANPLKRPESDEGIQANPSLFALESLLFSLDSFGDFWFGLEKIRPTASI